MRSLVLFSLLCAVVLAVPTVYEDGVEADLCADEVCKASDGCRCASLLSPLGEDQEIPQVTQ